MMADLEKLYVVEYSVLQDAFHVEPVRDMLRKNLGALSRLASTDYAPVALATSREKAAELATELREQVDQLIQSVRARRREAVLEALGDPTLLSDLLSSERWK